MDSSFETPSPVRPTITPTAQSTLPAENDQCIEDLFSPISTGGKTLPEPRYSSSFGSTPASAISGPLVNLSHARQQLPSLVDHLSTIAVTIRARGIKNSAFNLLDLQSTAIDTYVHIHCPCDVDGRTF